MEASILGVCDVVEAMSSHRPYRPARSQQEIMTELNEGKGKKYQPQIVDLMLNMMGNNELNLCFQGNGLGEYTGLRFFPVRHQSVGFECPATW